MDAPAQGTGPSQDGPATNDVGGWQILWFLLDLAAIYVLVELIVPWLAGWTRNILLLILQHPTPSGRFQFLFSHILELSFIPAFVLGLNQRQIQAQGCAIRVANTRCDSRLQVCDLPVTIGVSEPICSSVSSIFWAWICNTRVSELAGALLNSYFRL
jgi:hypothetical protein